MCLNETYGIVHIVRNLSDMFTTQNGLKQGYALPPQFFNFALKYAIRRAQENQEGLKLNRTHQPLAYANDVNTVGGNTGTLPKNIKAVLDASREVGLEVKPEKTKYMLMPHCQMAGQKHSIKIANRSSEDVAKFKYFVTPLTDQNCMYEEIKNRLNSENYCYYSVQSLLSSCLLSKNIKVKISKYNSAICFV
jgi:hypothetical protein